MVPLFPALRHRLRRQRSLSHGRNQRMDARRAGPRPVEVARQHGRSGRDRGYAWRRNRAHVGGFDPVKDAVAFQDLQPLDQYMLRQAVEVSADVQRSYEEFAFHKIYHRINNFCGVELSAFYFDVLKDRLYTAARKSASRRAAQTAIWRIGEALARLLAPIMSFTCEEVWQYLPPVEGRLESVHLTTFPEASDLLGTDEGAIAPEPKQA